MMQERGVINIQRDLADDRERVLAILEVENPDILRDQAANRVERQPAHRCFHAALVQFCDDPVAPLPSEPALGQIPSAPGQGEDDRDEKETQGSGARAMGLRSAPVKLPRQGGRSRFEKRRHGETSNVERRTLKR